MSLSHAFRPLRGALVALSVAVPCGSTAASEIENGLYLPFDDVPIVSTSGADLLLNGSAVIGTPEAGFSLSSDSLIANLTIEGAFTAELLANASGSFQQGVALPTAILPPIQVTPLVQIQPVMFLGAEVSGNAAAGMTTSLVQRFEIGTQINIGASLGVTQSDPTFGSRHGTPEITGTTAADVTVAVEAELIFFIVANGAPVGGPTISADFGATIRLEPLANPWWTIDSFVEIEAGAELLGGADVSTPIWSEQMRVADAGGPVPTAPSTTRWSRSFDLSDTEDATSIVPVGRGFLVVGNGQGPTNEAWIALLDETGSPIWERLSGTPPIGSRPAEAHELSDGGFVIGAVDAINGDARIDRIDAFGNLVWTSVYADGAGGTLHLETLLPRDDDGFVFAGRVTRGSDKTPVVVFVDDRGAIESALEYDLAGLSTDGGFSALHADDDGGLIAAGYAHWQDTAAFIDQTIAGKNALVCRITPDRRLDWARVIGGTGADEALDVDVDTDGTLVVCGHVSGEANDGWVARLGADGFIEWSGVYAGDGSSGNDRFTSVAVVAEGGYLVTGTTNVGASQDAWAMMTSTAGMPLWFKSMRGADTDALVDVVALGDGLVACGSTKSTGPNQVGMVGDAWVVRASVDGMLHFDAASGLDVVNDGARWSTTGDVVQFDFGGSLRSFTATSAADALTLSNVTSTSTSLTD